VDEELAGQPAVELVDVVDEHDHVLRTVTWAASPAVGMGGSVGEVGSAVIGPWRGRPDVGWGRRC